MVVAAVVVVEAAVAVVVVVVAMVEEDMEAEAEAAVEEGAGKASHFLALISSLYVYMLLMTPRRFDVCFTIPPNPFRCVSAFSLHYWLDCLFIFALHGQIAQRAAYTYTFVLGPHQHCA